jgi:hypothetical protein
MGLPPNHPWYITKYGDEFLTIQTDDLGGHYSRQDSIQVVHPSEVIRMADVPSEQEFFRDFMPSPSNPPSVPAFQPSAVPSGFQFNPVIKIVNGDDRSNNQGEIATKPGAVGGEKDELVGGTPYLGNTEDPIRFKSQPGGEKEQKSESSSSGGGFFDNFKNFVIKKLS